MHILKIISGGRTSTERAALDVAMALGIDHAGWGQDGGPVNGDPALDEKNAQAADATVVFSQMNEKQLAGVHARLDEWIQETFGFWQGNDKLLKSAETWTFHETTFPEDATRVVLRALSSRLCRTQRLC